jgi:hypothetical protein
MAVIPKDGFLYFLRDRDYRSGDISPYVKIGLTNADRPVKERVDEHQTGNPRQVFSAHEFQVNAVDTAETHLHHLWASTRVHGEWFLMDDAQVQTAIQQAKDLNDLIANNFPNFNSVKLLKSIHSNGKSRAGTQAEIDLLKLVLDTKKAHVLASAKSKLFNERIRKLMGINQGIDGVCSFQIKTTKEAIDKTKIQKDHPQLVAKYISKSTNLSGSFKAEYVNPQLRGLDEPLDAEIKAEIKAQTGGNDPANYSKSILKRSKLIERTHLEYLESLGEESSLAISLDLLTSQVKASIGDYDNVEGLGSWIRADKESESIDWKQFGIDNPKVIAANMKPEKQSVAMVVKPYRAYPI